MDYPDAVSQRAQDLQSQIVQNANFTGNGLPALVYEHLPQFVDSVSGIAGALALTVTLFASPVPAGGGLALLNNPLFPLSLLVIMVGIALLTGKLIGMAQARFYQENAKGLLGNRIFSYFGYQVYSTLGCNMDMRLYDQQGLCEQYWGVKNTEFGFGSVGKATRTYCAPMQALAEAIGTGFIGFAYLYVCLKAWAGAFGIGAVSQYIGAITMMASAVATLCQVIGVLDSNAEGLSTLFEYLDIPNTMYQGSLTTEKRTDRQYDVEFRDVSFRYPETDVWALRHVNVRFKIGSRLAVVGENGSGKTTFIKLLCRLYDPTEGKILLNGIDIRKYRYDDYMDIFSVVFQDFRLPAYTLAEAVAAGRKIDRARVGECLNLAGFGERLKSMPKGLDTMLYKELDKEGIEVSGGEAQKIAIARTLYKDAPFLILDEPTAALDPKAEAEIYTRFDAIANDKTAVYISHRLSSCKFCDEIAVFEHGQIVQTGTHESLLAETGGKYRALWNAQAQYYTE